MVDVSRSILMAQPEIAARMLGKSLYKAQGMLARFLICAPASRIGTRAHDGGAADPRDDERLRRYWQAIRQLLELPPSEDHDVGGLDPPCLALSPEARALLVEAYNSVEAAQQDNGELVTIRRARLKGCRARLQDCRRADLNGGGSTPSPWTSTRCGAAWGSRSSTSTSRCVSQGLPRFLKIGHAVKLAGVAEAH